MNMYGALQISLNIMRDLLAELNTTRYKILNLSDEIRAYQLDEKKFPTAPNAILFTAIRKILKDLKLSLYHLNMLATTLDNALRFEMEKKQKTDSIT